MILYLIGAIQGLLTAIILLFRKPRTLSLIFLAALILSLSLQLDLISYYSQLIGSLPFLRIIGWVLPFVFAPITYLYLRSYLTDRVVTLADLRHTIPAVLGPPVDRLAQISRLIDERR